MTLERTLQDNGFNIFFHTMIIEADIGSLEVYLNHFHLGNKKKFWKTVEHALN